MHKNADKHSKPQVADLEEEYLEKGRENYRKYLEELHDLSDLVFEKPAPQYGPPSEEHPLSDNRPPR